MKFKNCMPFCVITILTIFSINLQGQSIERQVLSIGAGSTLINGGYTSFTIGETIIGTISNDEIVLTQGFQQNDLEIPNAVLSFEEIGIMLYPNPTQNKLFIKGYDLIKLNDLYIVDALGRVVSHPEKYSFLDGIDVSHLNMGQYFLLLGTDNTWYAGSFVKE